MRAMAQSLSFGKSVMDKGWGMFVAFLAYKAKRAGKHLVKVSKWFPSSQRCHECGILFPNRDVNAALNIRDEAVRIALSA